jgi:hypothetical protein
MTISRNDNYPAVHGRDRQSASRHGALRCVCSVAAIRTIVTCCAALLAAGCVQFVQPKPPPPDPVGNFVPLTKPTIFVGDTQEHETTGFPLHDNDGAVDAYVEVAQRPPEQPLFGRRVLEWVLTNQPEPTVHLGDLLDMSCQSEMGRMGALIRAAKSETALLPGNHDGLMFGIFNAPVVGDVLKTSGHAWYRGCIRGASESSATTPPDPREAAVDRRQFIAAYLNVLGTDWHHPITGIPRVPANGDIRISFTNADPTALLAAIEANVLDETSYGNSFIAQKLRLPAAPGAKRRVIVIGLDTNQVNALVGTLDTVRGLSPGDLGHVRADQLRAIGPWVEEARRAGDIVVFAGHHNWNRLSFASQARIGAAMKTLDHPLVYVSAHTHRGFWATHDLGQRSLLELNVSSLSDWPIAYRRVSIDIDEKANRLRVRGELMPNLGKPTQSYAELLDAWESLTCGAAGIPKYQVEDEELVAVRSQKAARGTLFDWLYEGLGDWCRPCLESLYESGLRYQDVLMTAIDQFYQDFFAAVPEVAALRPPAFCGTPSVPVCIAKLRAARPADLEGSIKLFRERARFVDTINMQLDKLENPRIRNYMACRAVVGAKVDYELTAEDKRGGRGEDDRRNADFFRVEATVGME